MDMTNIFITAASLMVIIGSLTGLVTVVGYCFRAIFSKKEIS
jgi:hypothetical protein